MGVLLNEKEAAAAAAAAAASPAVVVAASDMRRQERKERFSFRHCCCGCSLQTGAIVIGSFGLMNGLTSILIALYGFGHLNQKQLPPGGEYGTTIYDLFPGDENVLSSAIMIFYGLLHVITAFCLIYGADKKRPSLLKFWLFTRYIEFAMSIVGSVFIVSTMLMQQAPAAAVFTSSFSFLICIGILVYCIGIIRSFYHEVMMENIPLIKQVI